MEILLDTKPVTDRPRISMTPLIDIVFILLIFFVLESSFIQLGEIDFHLPVEATSAESMGQSGVFEIQLFSAERLWIAGQQLALTELNTYLEKQQLASDTRIVLAVQSQVSVQLLVSAMDVMRANNLHRIELSAVDAQ